MKIVISPSKALDVTRPLPTHQYSQPQFLAQAQTLNSILVTKPPQVLCRIMLISEKLAELNWQRNQDFSTPFTPENARPAVYAFDGGFYKGLDVYSLPESKLEILQQRLRILSGLYGILKPLDLMQPYRLEMGLSLEVGPYKNLYEFWQKRLTAYLNHELQEGELFINLASIEYFSAVNAEQLKVPVITPIFKDWKNNTLKIIGFVAKKARGAMVRYLVDTNAQTLEDLKGFNRNGYAFSREHTVEDHRPVFVR